MRINIDFQIILTVIFFVILVSMQFALNKIIVLLKEIDRSLKRITDNDRIHREG